MLCTPISRRFSSSALQLGLVSVASVSLGSAIADAQGERPMTVRDCIERVTFDESSFNGQQAAHFSPDGHYFFVVTHRGVLKTGELESTIWVFDSTAVSNALHHGGQMPQGRAVAGLRALSNSKAISDAHWMPDSARIAFIGRSKTPERRLYVVNVKVGQPLQLSPAGKDVSSFYGVRDIWVFSTARPISDAQRFQSAGPDLQDIVYGRGQSIFDLLYPNWGKPGGDHKDVWQVRAGKASPVVLPGSSKPISLTGGNLALSPAGRYAAMTNAADAAPAVWETYESSSSFVKIAADKPGVERAAHDNRPNQYQLIDLQTGKRSVLVDAPLGDAGAFVDVVKVLWSSDSKEVILANTYLPLEGSQAAGLPPSKRPWVVSVDVATRKVTPIKETPVRDEHARVRMKDIDWLVPDRELVLRYIDYHDDTSLEPEIMKKENGTWTALTDPAAIRATAEKASSPRDFSVYVHQGLNEWPVLTAKDPKTGNSEPIWNPNPQFAKLRLGEVSIYKWKDAHGNAWTGGLIKPPDYVPGHTYPLVIQTHGFDQKEFMTEGPFPTAMAARPIAGRGMVVLQTGGPDVSLSVGAIGTPQEATRMGEGYVGAIEQLAHEGLIDPRKVGIIGFSRTGWYLLDSLVHAKQYFAAVTLAECTYSSFGEYTLNADYGGPGRAKEIASMIGPPPFGAGLGQWISHSAGFHTNDIDVPILYEANSPVAMLYEWDMYALMRLQNKSVDLIYFRNGEHVLAKPLERLVSQEANVDWYDFWLNGHEDPDPRKGDQYARWRELRKMQAENDAKARAQATGDRPQ